jgi:hypothetical protein
MLQRSWKVKAVKKAGRRSEVGTKTGGRQETRLEFVGATQGPDALQTSCYTDPADAQLILANGLLRRFVKKLPRRGFIG